MTMSFPWPGPFYQTFIMRLTPKNLLSQPLTTFMPQNRVVVHRHVQAWAPRTATIGELRSGTPPDSAFISCRAGRLAGETSLMVGPPQTTLILTLYQAFMNNAAPPYQPSFQQPPVRKIADIKSRVGAQRKKTCYRLSWFLNCARNAEIRSCQDWLSSTNRLTIVPVGARPSQYSSTARISSAPWWAKH
jgi:hypothetical protein